MRAAEPDQEPARMRRLKLGRCDGDLGRGNRDDRDDPVDDDQPVGPGQQRPVERQGIGLPTGSPERGDAELLQLPCRFDSGRLLDSAEAGRGDRDRIQMWHPSSIDRAPELE